MISIRQLDSGDFVARSFVVGRPRQHPKPIVPVYRKLGKPRREIVERKPVRIDGEGETNQAESELQARMKVLESFMTNFTTQYYGDPRTSPQPTTRLVTSRTSTNPSRAHLNDLLDNEDITRILNNESPQPSLQTISTQQQQHHGRGQRPMMTIRSRTMDPEHERVASGVMTMTRRENSMPLTYCGDVRAPTPALFPRENPDLWMTITPRHVHPQPPPPKISQESVNVANIRRILESNRVKLANDSAGNSTSKSTMPSGQQQQQQRDSVYILAKSRTMSPVKSVRSEHSPRTVTSATVKTLSASVPTGSNNNNNQEQPQQQQQQQQQQQETKVTGQQTRSNSASSGGKKQRMKSPRKVKSSMGQTIGEVEKEISTNGGREKSSKTVRFQLVEDVRFFSPHDVSPLGEPAATPEHSGGEKDQTEKPTKQDSFTSTTS